MGRGIKPILASQTTCGPVGGGEALPDFPVPVLVPVLHPISSR